MAYAALDDNELGDLHADAAGPDALPPAFLVADQGAHAQQHNEAFDFEEIAI
jgi:hypothetical protein